jgi:type IV secretion system protein VirD4
MMKSLAARVLYAPKDFAEANEISQELGFTTVKVKSHSKPRMAAWSRKSQQGNISVSEQRRALLLPQEVKELGATMSSCCMKGCGQSSQKRIGTTKIHSFRKGVFRRLNRRRPD